MNASKMFWPGSLRILALIIIGFVPRAMQAQSIYSVNLIGYVDASFVAGSNLIANPLFARDNSISNLLRSVPDGSLFIPWDRVTQQFGATNHRIAGSWSSPQATLVAPDGGFLILPSAAKVTFIGAPWSDVGGPGCLTYANGPSVVSWLPRACCGFDCQVGPPFASDLTTISRWDRQAKAYVDYFYFEDFGWVPSDPPPLAPDESVLFNIVDSFMARGPFVGSLPPDFPVPTRVESASMVQPQRSGTNFTFSWASTTNMNYGVFGSRNLGVVNWQLVDRGTAAPINGVCTVTFGSTNAYAFYRLQQDWSTGPWPVLLPGGGHRPNSFSFSFQFYAPVATNYVVERTASLLNPAWLTVTNRSAGPSNIVAVVDGAATDAVRYYRVRY